MNIFIYWEMPCKIIVVLVHNGSCKIAMSSLNVVETSLSYDTSPTNPFESISTISKDRDKQGKESHDDSVLQSKCPHITGVSSS